MGPPAPSPITTIVLDLDDTLVATSRSYEKALSVLSWHGVDPEAFVAAHRRWWAVYVGGGCARGESLPVHLGSTSQTPRTIRGIAPGDDLAREPPPQYRAD